MSEPVHCPDCNQPLEISQACQKGETLECENCGVKLKVIQTEPLKVKTVTNTGTCPDCNQPINIDQPLEVGEVIECDSCAAELEVLQIDPLEVALIEEEK